MDNPLIQEIFNEIEAWQNSWHNNPVKLELTRILNNQYLLLDTRGVNKAGLAVQIINRNQAFAVLIDRPVAVGFCYCQGVMSSWEQLVKIFSGFHFSGG